MASIERTAYPRFKRHLSAKELATLYTPTPQEIAFARETARGSAPLLSVVVLLKAIQCLGYFPRLDEVPPAIVGHIRTALRVTPHVQPEVTPRSLYKYHQAIRQHLQITPDGQHTRHVAARAVYQAAQVMDNPADLINVAIEELIHARCELPAYSTLDRLAQRVRTVVNRRFFQLVADRVTERDRQCLDALLETSVTQQHTPYNDLKQRPQSPTRAHLHDLLTHTAWLASLARSSGPCPQPQSSSRLSYHLGLTRLSARGRSLLQTASPPLPQRIRASLRYLDRTNEPIPSREPPDSPGFSAIRRRQR